MLKRSIAWVLALTLALSLLPVGVLAEEPGSTPLSHSHSAQQHDCEHCDETIIWKAWEKTDSLPEESGHYYLTAEVKLLARTDLTGTTDQVICLNGYSIDCQQKCLAWYVQDTAKLTVCDCTAYTDDEDVFYAGTIKNGRATGAMAGAIYAKNNCSISLYDCIFADNNLVKNSNSATGYGGAVQLRGDKEGTAPSLFMENVLFEGNTSGMSAGALCVMGSKTMPAVTAKNCTFRDNSANSGGAMYLTEADAEFENCIFEENSAATGGAMYLANSEAYFEKCTITKNESTGNNAGNIQNKTSTSEFDGCIIENNTSAGTAGSAFYIHGGSSKVTLKDTSVANNSHTGTGTTFRGGIYVTNKTDKLIVSGKTVVKGNKIATGATAAERNIFIQTAPNAVDVGGLSEGAFISVFTNWGTDETPTFVTAATAPAQWSKGWVLYERNNLAVNHSAAEGFYFDTYCDHIHCQCGLESCTDPTHSKVELTAWEKTDALPTAGNYYLTNHVTLTAQATISADLNLCLNGFTVTQTGEENRVIGVTDSQLLLTSCKANAAITGGDAIANGGGGILASGSATQLKVYHITIDGNGSATHGGGIFVTESAKATLVDVTVSNNTAGGNGAGIAVRSGGQLTAADCVITGNESEKDGAGIYGQAGTKVTITNTEFTSNTVNAGAGGGVAISGEATLTGLTISKNHAVNGGGMITQGSAVATMEDSTVTENTASRNGGGIYVSKNLTLNDTTVTDNEAGYNSNGIYVGANQVLTLDGKTIVKDNGAANVFLASTHKVKFGKLTDGAQIGFTTNGNTARAISAATAEDPTAYLRSDYADLRPVHRDQVVYLEANTDHIHCLCNGASSHCDHSKVAFMEWTSTDSLPTSGNYYLSNDVVLTEEMSISEEVCICLNGHTVTAAQNKRHISTPKDADAHIRITDCTATTNDGVYTAGKLIGGRDVSNNTGGGSIYIRTGGALELYEGIITDNASYVAGGALLFAADATFYMYGGEISGNQAKTAQDAWKNGGAIYGSGKSDIQLLGGTIKNNEGSAGGAIYYNGDGKMTIGQVAITDNVAQTGNGGAIYAKSVDLAVTGATISGNWAAKDGGAIYINDGKLDISGNAKFIGNEDASNGGAISYGSNSTGVIDGATFDGNKAGSAGGAMIVQNGANVEIKNALFQNNVSNSRGAIYVYNAALKFGGGTITKNTTSGGANGIDVNKGSVLTITGGTITENNGGVGGVRFEDSALSLAGAPVIKGNENANLVVPDGSVFQVADLQTGAAIGVTGVMGLISGPCEDLSAYFAADSKYLDVVYKEGALHLATAAEHIHKHCLCDAAVSGCDHTKLEWTPWDGTTTLPVSGNYYLVQDVVLSKEMSISGELNLCLNGHTVTAAQNKRHISTPKDADACIRITDCTATIKDGVYTAGKLIGGRDVSNNTGGGSIYIRTGGTLELFEGIISDNASYVGGGAVLLAEKTSFIMYGGQISGNKAFDATEESWKIGGGVYAFKDAEVQLLGGTIRGNEGSTGGGVGCYDGCVLTLAGTVITENIAHNQGGGVQLRASAFEMSGGKITKNTAMDSGGGLCLGSGTEAVMTGGEITENTAATGGGVIIQSKAKLQLKDGKVDKNAAEKGSGGIGIYSEGSLYMSGGSVSGNTATKDGGGIYLTKSHMEISGDARIGENTTDTNGGGISFGAQSTGKISGGVIEKNKSRSAGGIIVQNEAMLEITGGTIRNNSATGASAGAIWVYKSELKLTGGTISGNTAARDGGAIYISGSHMDMSGDVKITGNKTKGNGGGLSIGTGSTATISGGTIENNQAKAGGGIILQNAAKLELAGGTICNNSAITTYGGGIWVYKAELKFTGGTISDNSAIKEGGGVYVSDSKMNMSGSAKVTGNKTKGNGGGVDFGTGSIGTIYGGTVANNEANAGGGLMVQNESKVTIHNANIYNNVAKGKNGGAAWVYKAELTVNGGTISGNTAVKDGGGFYLYQSHTDITNVKFVENRTDTNGGAVSFGSNSTGNISNCVMENNQASAAGALIVQNSAAVVVTGTTINKNTALKSGGAIYLYKATLDMKDSFLTNNTSDTVGGGMRVSATGTGTMENVVIEGNKNQAAVTSGGGVYLDVDIEYSFIDCQFLNNKSTAYGGGLYAANGAVPTMVNCTVSGNEAGQRGGGILVRDCANLTDCTFVNNKADMGAGIYAGNITEHFAVNGYGSKGDDIGLFMNGCTVKDNVATTDGGGLHLDMSCYATIDETTFTGNTAGKFGSAMWLWENATLTNITATGNTCTENGYAVYFADAEFDGQTYINGLFKMGDDMIVKDNQGGDMFLANKVTIGALPQGYGQNTHVEVTLDAGLLTQRIFGQYHYEGGDLVYTLTYGDRSMTDPEYAVPEATASEDPSHSSEPDQAGAQDTTLLYAGIGAIAAVIVLAALTVVLVKKKKAGKAADEVSKN